MRFFLIIIVVVASGAGLHFLDVINKFQGSTAEKVRAIKPESIRNKIKEPKTSQPVYTFFETLDDHTMTKYVDLKQGLLSTALLPE